MAGPQPALFAVIVRQERSGLLVFIES